MRIRKATALSLIALIGVFALNGADNSFSMALQRAQDAFIKKDNQAVEEILAKAENFAVSPKDKVALLFLRGRLFEAQDRNDEALKVYLELASIQKEQSKKLDALMNAAGIFLKTGETKKAREIYENMLALPGLTEEDILSIKCAVAMSYTEEKNYSDAIESYIAILDEGMLSQRVHIAVINAMADIYRIQREFEKARDLYKKIQDLPDVSAMDRYSALEQTAYTYAEEDSKHREIDSSFNKIINDKDVDRFTKVRMLKRLAQIRLENDQVDRARQEYNRISWIPRIEKGTQIEAIMNVARLWEKQKNYEQARREYLRIIRDNNATTRQLVDAMSASAQTWLEGKEYKTARREYERILMLPDLSREDDVFVRKKITYCILPAKDEKSETEAN